MRAFVLPLALLFIAFTDPSIAQTAGAAAGEVAQEVSVAAGEPLVVECSLRVEQRAAWRRVGGGELAADLRPGPERPLAGGRLAARLTAPAARAAHAGVYACHAGAPPVRVTVLPPLRDGASPPPPAGESPATPAPAGAAATDDTARDLVMFELYHPLRFNCSPADSAAAAAVSEYTWVKNGTVMSGFVESGRGPSLSKDGAVLSFERPFEDDFGNYTCLVGGSVARAWQAHARPVARVHANTNVVEGQKVSISCKLIGKPYPRVAWTYAAEEGANGTELDTAGADSRFSVKPSESGVPGGVLELRDAVRADAGVYACVPPDGTPAHTTLRVKDVYAALWPFLGICLEVFILCAIILVYEKRRTKPELEEDDADAHDQKKS